MNIQQHTCGVGTEEGAWGCVLSFHYFKVRQYVHSQTLETYRCTGVKLNEHSTTHLWVQKRGLGAWGCVPLFHYLKVRQYEHGKTLETCSCQEVKLNQQ